MGIPLSLPTARVLAPASFAFNFGAQLFGMLSSPNMKEISDANPAAFSPQPMMIAYFFGPQQVLQLYWLWKLWRGPRTDPEQLKFAGTYVLGNVCIGAWSFFWHEKMFVASQACVAINTIAQLLYVGIGLPPMSASNWPTYLNAVTFAGIGVLDFLHNGSVAFFPRTPPSALVQGLTGAGFAVGTLLSDYKFGACLAYDLLAMYLGQQGEWKSLLGWYTVGAAAVVGLKYVFVAKPLKR